MLYYLILRGVALQKKKKYIYLRVALGSDSKKVDNRADISWIGVRGVYRVRTPWHNHPLRG